MANTPYYGYRSVPARRRRATFDEAFKKGQIRQYGTVKVTFDDILHMVRKMPPRTVNQALKQAIGLISPAEAKRLEKLASVTWKGMRRERVLPVFQIARRQRVPDSQETLIEGTQDTIDEEPELLPPQPRPRRRVIKKKKTSKK